MSMLEKHFGVDRSDGFHFDAWAKSGPVSQDTDWMCVLGPDGMLMLKGDLKIQKQMALFHSF